MQKAIIVFEDEYLWYNDTKLFQSIFHAVHSFSGSCLQKKFKIEESKKKN